MNKIKSRIGITIKYFTATVLISLLYFASFGKIEKKLIPPPPKGCLKGGRMYTNFDYVITLNDDGTYVDEYRYVFKNSPSYTCYTGGTVFLGPSPSNQSQMIAIGCDIGTFVNYGQTGHNNGYNSFTITCPLDSYSFFLLILSAIPALIFITKQGKIHRLSS